LISFGFLKNNGSVATPSGNKSTLVWGDLPVSFASDFAFFFPTINESCSGTLIR
jgi:hypothetical protein